MGSLTKLDPWPYSAKLSGIGLKLRPDPQTGALLSGVKVQPFAQAAPLEYNYSTTPPYLEKAYEFRRLIMGMGEKFQQFAIVRRYFWADGVDCSINGMPMLGMEFTTVTPTNTGEVRGFVEHNVDWAVDDMAQFTVEQLKPYDVGPPGTPNVLQFNVGHPAIPKLFALCGQYVNVRNDDTDVGWVTSHDFGSGVVVQMSQRWKDAGSSPLDALYVATDLGRLWQYDGANDTGNWRDITDLLSTTVANQSATCLETNNNLLVRTWNNLISTCSADPTVAANWSSPIPIGDASQPITWIRTLSGTVFIIKADGVYDVDANGTAHNLFSDLHVTPDLSQGRNAAVWNQILWVRFGDAFYSLGPNSMSGTIEMHPVGIERQIENDSHVKGYVTASAGWEGWFNFIAVYNPASQTSFLIKYGAWFADDQPPLGSSAFVRQTAIYNPIAAGSSFFEPVLHGPIASFVGKKITAMFVSALPGPNQRLYLGFDDGTIAWGILPRGSPNPLGDENCRYQATGNLKFSGHTMGFPGSVKAYRGATVFGPRLDDRDTAIIEYRTTPAKDKSVFDLNVFTVLQMKDFEVGDLGSGDYKLIGSFTTPSQRIDIVQSDGTVGDSGTAVDVKLTLSASSNVSTPWIEGFALHEMLRPDLLLERDFVVEARDRMPRRDGSNDWRTAEQIRQTLQDAASAKGTVPMVMPDGATMQVEVIDYQEQLASEQARFGNAWDISIKAVEFRTNVQFGTVERVGSYTVGDLHAFTILDLGVI